MPAQLWVRAQLFSLPVPSPSTRLLLSGPDPCFRACLQTPCCERTRVSVPARAPLRATPRSSPWCGFPAELQLATWPRNTTAARPTSREQGLVAKLEAQCLSRGVPSREQDQSPSAHSPGWIHLHIITGSGTLGKLLKLSDLGDEKIPRFSKLASASTPTSTWHQVM